MMEADKKDSDKAHPAPLSKFEAQLRASRTSRPCPPPPLSSPFLLELLRSFTDTTLGHRAARSSRTSSTKIPSQFRILSSSAHSAVSTFSVFSQGSERSLLDSFMLNLFDEKGVINPKEDVILIDDNFENKSHNPSAMSTMDISQNIHNNHQVPSVDVGDSDGSFSMDAFAAFDDSVHGNDVSSFINLASNNDQVKYQDNFLCMDTEADDHRQDAVTASCCGQDSCQSIELITKKSEIISANHGNSPTSIMDVFLLPESLPDV
jgi:hypothetical protein